MTVLRHVNKSPRVKSLQQFIIQLYSYNNKLISEEHTGERNPLFERAIRHSNTTY